MVQKYLRPAAVKAGVIKEGEKVRFGFHNFRHALATALVKLKVDAKTVQGMLRHEDFGTTMQLYAQSDMESMREAQGKFLDQLLGDRIHLLRHVHRPDRRPRRTHKSNWAARPTHGERRFVAVR